MHFTSRSCLNFIIKKRSPPPEVVSSDLRFGCGDFFSILHEIFFRQYSQCFLLSHARTLISFYKILFHKIMVIQNHKTN